MARCDQITIHQLVRGWLNQLEVEHLNLFREAAALFSTHGNSYTENQKKYAEWKLATLRQLRQRIPNAWKKSTVTE